jgi:hypothetical protein
LTGDFKTQLVEAAERSQVRAVEGSVWHVEVFRTGRVRTPIFGRPRPLPGHRRADDLYTLNCEEPQNLENPPHRLPAPLATFTRTISTVVALHFYATG